MFRRLLLLLVVLPWLAGSVARAGQRDPLDFSAWRQLPVFEDGRMQPLDTLARSVVERICGRESPRLALAGALPDVDTTSAEFAVTRQLFPDGQPRTFDAAELLFSWMVEPQKWQRVPLMAAGHKVLRKDVLRVPLLDSRGSRLKYVSVWQVQHARRRLNDRWEKIRQRAQSEGEDFELVGVDKQISRLLTALEQFDLATFNPTLQGESSPRFSERQRKAFTALESLARNFQQDSTVRAEEVPRDLIRQAGMALSRQFRLSNVESFSLAEVDAATAEFRRLAEELDEELDGCESKTLVSLSADLRRQTTEMHLALYDNGRSLRLVPALNPGALEENRLPDDDAQPWLSLAALIYGSDAVLREYPPAEVRTVRETFEKVKAVYLDRGKPGRREAFSAAMEQFAAAVGQLAEAIEPLRAQLPIRHRDENLIAATAYPPPGYTRVEVHYNRFDPFFWSCVVGLAALVSFAFSFGYLRKPMFWTGAVVLVAAQLFAVYGFGLRWYITGWVPVANMFETVVFVALVGAFLGLWFTLLPMIYPGWRNAWRLTAAPLGWEAGPLDQQQAALGQRPKWSAAGWVLLVPRAYLMYEVFYWLTQVKYGVAAGYTAIGLVPRTSVGSPVSGIGAATINDLLTWGVGLCVLALSVWYVPRLALAALVSIVTIPLTLARQGLIEPSLTEQVLARKPLALVGAAVGFLASALAYFAPASVLHKEIGLPMPILRDNFWLFMHVLSITASYGAGALAWGLGNVSLTFYLFGRYHKPAADTDCSLPRRQPGDVEDKAPRSPRGVRPPEVCKTLGGFVYKATQVAVLLLAAGTILGALWADVAWGSFWSWDAKEVWALISLLIYLGILHGRYAGWSGDYGLAAGSVVGMTAILTAWYGVNFVLDSGNHSYGSGSGGMSEVLIAVACNWALTLAAGLRYFIETRKP